MNLQNNTGLKKSIVLFTFLTLSMSGIALYYSWKLALILFINSLLFSIAHLIITYKRYKDIEKLYEKINFAMTKDLSIDFSDYKEGELYILQSEIQKLVSRLKEQTTILQQDKIDLVDFLTDVSHQIRTPLTSITLLINRLNEEKLTPFERKQRVKEIEKLLERMDWLITSLLKLSKLDANVASFQQKQVSVQSLIQQSISPLEIAMELKEQQLKVSIEDNASFIGDLSWSIEAIGNILKNCIDHMPIGGRLEIYAKQNAIFTEIIITDTGPGILKEDLPHIFKRFYKGKVSKEGSVGIGLALARKIIAKQNGTIKVENRSSHGVKFTIKFYHTTI